MQRNDLHLAQITLAMYQKGVCYSGIKIFNDLPKAIKDISSKPNKFKVALKHFLHKHSVNDDHGSKTDQKYARRRDGQNYFGKIKQNLGLSA
jgi:hypothetical protein